MVLMTTYHVFGDTGGHYRQLLAGLINLGYDNETGKLPEGHVVVHCGDLIHKGPLSASVVALVDKIMTNNPGQWVQLLGNHEINYLPYAPHFWNEKFIYHREAIETIVRWYESGAAKIAFGLPASAKFERLEVSAKPKLPIPEKPILFTHAGLPWDYWAEKTGKETDIDLLVEKLNAVPMREASRAGSMLYGTKLNPAYGAVGPMWAHSISEVWETWVGRDQPFIQVHGHTNPFDFESNRWYQSAPTSYRKLTKLNHSKRITVAELEGNMQISIDPGFEKRDPKLAAQTYITITE